MGISGIKFQITLLLVTALAALGMALTAGLSLNENINKTVIIWILALAAIINAGLGFQVRTLLDSVPAERATNTDEATASADLTEAIQKITTLESELRVAQFSFDKEREANDQLRRRIAGGRSVSFDSEDPSSSQTDEQNLGRPYLEVSETLRSLILQSGDRSQVSLAGGTRLEVCLTLDQEEVKDIRQIMAAIGRVISRPILEEFADSKSTDGEIKIMLVDDDRTCRMIFKALLPKDLKVSTTEFDDGLAAINSLQAPPYPDIIVCDIMMPNLDGFEFLAKLRDLPMFISIPVIMVTSNAYRENVSKAAALNVCRFLKKPLRRDTVHSAVQFAISQNERKQSSIIEAQEKMCLDDRAYFELACGLSRSVTLAITFVRNCISRDRWNSATLKVDALKGSILLVGDQRLATSLSRVAVELQNWNISGVTLELERLEAENERYARALIHLFGEEFSPGILPVNAPDKVSLLGKSFPINPVDSIEKLSPQG